MRLRSIALYTTGNMRSSSPYHPRGASIFPFSAENMFARRKQNSNEERNTRQKRSSKETLRLYKGKHKETPSSSPSVLLQASSFRSCDRFQVSKAPKSGSGESDPESLVPSGVGWCAAKRRCVEWLRPVVRRNWWSGRAFSM